MKQKNEMLNSMPNAVTPILSIIVIVCAIMLFPSSPVMAAIILILASLILFEKVIMHFVRVRKMKEYISNAASDDEELQNNEALFKSMNPIAGIRFDGSVAWYNSAFKELFSIISEKKISELIPEVNVKKLYNEGGRVPVIAKIGDCTFSIKASVTKKKSVMKF